MNYLRIVFALALIELAPALSFANLTEMDRTLEILSGAYSREGGNPKALKQLRCFLKKHGASSFVPKAAGSDMYFRCNIRQGIQLTNEEHVAIIDYTKTSNLGRFFIFDLKNKKLQTLRVAHGRYGDTDRSNTRVMYSPKRNSVLKVVHFSNVVGSNASASGFYLTGHQYEGQWGDSLVLHGLEKNVNDNSCERATVIHKSAAVTSSTVNAMSSGCPMVPVNQIQNVLQWLREGTALYVYSPSEAALADDQCGRGLTKN